MLWLLLFGAPAALAIEGALLGERTHLLIGVVAALMVLAVHLSVTGRPVRPRSWLLTQLGLVLTAASVALQARVVAWTPGDQVAWYRGQFHRDLAVVLCVAGAAACLGIGLRSSGPLFLLAAAVVLGARGWAAIDAAWQSHRSLGHYEDLSGNAFVITAALTRVGGPSADLGFAAGVAAALLSPALLVLSRSRRAA